MLDCEMKPIPLDGKLKKYNKGGYENINHAMFDGVGIFDFPEIRPVKITKDEIPEMISFNYATNCDEPEIHGVHFFIDDYQFHRVWQNPDKYTRILSRFSLVTEPDFSAYSDFPLALRIWNIYRKKWCAAYWQRHGLRVIPSIDIASEEDSEWFYDGLPRGGTLAISPLGTSQDDSVYCDGLRGLLKYLEPNLVMSFGNLPCDVSDLTEVVRLRTFTDRLHEMRRSKSEE